MDGSQATLIKSEVDFQRLINGESERLVSRTSNLLQNKSFTDVTFIVGPPSHSKKYVGHRVLLAMTSPVFEAMFYGDMADKSKVIRIPDLAPIGFENLLRYAYTDSLNLNSVEDAMLTAYSAKKYLLPHLLRECLNYIDKNITSGTACSVLEFASVLNSQQLLFQALQIIDRQTYHVITHKSFSIVQLQTLEMISGRKYLNLYSEYSLFNAVIQWAIAECKRRGLNSNDWSIVRSVLDDSAILRNIRFLTMSGEEFTRVIAQTTTGESQVDLPGLDSYSDSENLFKNSFLTNNEQIGIFMNLNIPGIKPMPKGLCGETAPRVAPPDYFVARRYKPVTYATATSLNNSGANSSNSKTVKIISSKFQIMTCDLFIIGMSIPIRLDPGYYSVRSPKLECQLKFSTKIDFNSDITNHITGNPISSRNQDEANVTLDTLDDSISVIISKDKDCHVKLKKPIAIKKGNINELLLTFHTSTHLNDDLVIVKGHKGKIGQMEMVDGEGITWIFMKTNTIEFNELYYYY